MIKYVIFISVSGQFGICVVWDMFVTDSKIWAKLLGCGRIF